jgi:drug/metabolite transporter (DMT)-like permease
VTSAQIIRVVLWMTGTLLSFSVMAVSVRELAGRFSVFEILAIRSGIGLLLTLGLGVVRPAVWRTAMPRMLGMHALRNGTHFASQYLWALSLTLLPLATVFALEFTMPLWATLLAALFLGELLTPSRIGAVACGFLGVLIILRPGFGVFNPYTLLVLLAAFGYATSNIATKKLTMAQTTFTIVLMMNVMQLPLAYLGSDPAFFYKIDASNILAVLGIGIAGLTAHFCLTNALAAGDATVVLPLDFMRLPLIAVVGWLLYGEQIDIFVLIGAAAIIAGVLWNLNSESRKGAPIPRGGKE